MSKILKVRNVNDYSRYLGCADQHPLVSVIDYAEVSPIRHTACTGWRQGKPSPKCPTASASSTPQHFSRMFKKQEGVTPSEYVGKMRL